MARTPGPWKVGLWSGQCRIPEHVRARHHPGPTGGCVYDLVFYEGRGIATATPGVEVLSFDDDGLVVSEADLTLMAAAPELLEQRDELRAALVRLVGVDGRVELEQMEAAMRLVRAPAADVVAIIDAIHALIATLGDA